MTEDQLKLIRRREYYARRVKRDFKPKLAYTEETFSDDNSEAISPLGRIEK